MFSEVFVKCSYASFKFELRKTKCLRLKVACSNKQMHVLYYEFIFRYRSGTVQFLLLLPMYLKQRYSIISDEVVNTGCSY